MSNTHFVEVVPNEVYWSNEEFQKWEEAIVFQFIDQYPDQGLCFISDDAIVPPRLRRGGIEKTEYETKGEFFDLLYSFN